MIETSGDRKLIIIDDHPLFRDALAAATSIQGVNCDIQFADSIDSASAIVSDFEPDLILLDLNLKSTSGLDSLIELQNQRPDLKIAIVSANEDPEVMERAFALGAVGFIPKSAGLLDLQEAVTKLLHGEIWMPSGFQRESSDRSNASQMATKLASLTPAQRRVLSGLKEGLLNKQIAYEMGISEATVKAHMTAIFRKLGVASRTQALLSLQSVTSN